MSAAGPRANSDSALAALLDWAAILLAAPPDEADIARLQSAEARRTLLAIAEEWRCHAAVRAMVAVLAADVPPRTLALDLSVSYTRLFEGVAGHPPVSLFESTSPVPGNDAAPGGGARLYGPAAGAMDQLLRRFNLRLAGMSSPADHIAVELALYATLLRAGDAADIASMRAHLARWIPTWAERCQLHDPGGFYGAVGALVCTLLRAGDASPQPIACQHDGSHHATPQ